MWVDLGSAKPIDLSVYESFIGTLPIGMRAVQQVNKRRASQSLTDLQKES